MSSGISTTTVRLAATSAAQPRGPSSRRGTGSPGRWRRPLGGAPKALGGGHLSALERKDALRPLLDEDDDEDQHHDLGQHRALPAFEQLVQHAQAEAGVDGAGELADAAEHDDHEAVDDVALAEVGADIADLAQRAAGQARDAGAQREGVGVDARRVHADARRHAPVLRHAAHEQAQPRLADQQRHAEQHQPARRR